MPPPANTHLIPAATTFASHGPGSVARKNGRRVRGGADPNQPVNDFLDCMRVDWDSLTIAERIVDVRRSLLFIADPVSDIDEFGHPLGSYTLGELYHARVVLLRLLPHLVEANTASEEG